MPIEVKTSHGNIRQEVVESITFARPPWVPACSVVKTDRVSGLCGYPRFFAEFYTLIKMLTPKTRHSKLPDYVKEPVMD